MRPLRVEHFNFQKLFWVDWRQQPHQFEITPASYSDLADAFQTSGSWPGDPGWDWALCGNVKTSRGPLLVAPFEWIVEITEGVIVVMTDEQFDRLYPDYQPDLNPTYVNAPQES